MAPPGGPGREGARPEGRERPLPPGRPAAGPRAVAPGRRRLPPGLEALDGGSDGLVEYLQHLPANASATADENARIANAVLASRTASPPAQFVADAGRDLARRLEEGPVRLDRFELQAELGEATYWDPQAEVLWWIDIYGPTIHRYDPATGKDETWQAPEYLGTISVRDKGGLVVTMASGFYFFDPASGKFTPIIDPESGIADTRFNDGKTDRQGRFWSGSMWEAPPKPTALPETAALHWDWACPQRGAAAHRRRHQLAGRRTTAPDNRPVLLLTLDSQRGLQDDAGQERR